MKSEKEIEGGTLERNEGQLRKTERNVFALSALAIEDDIRKIKPASANPA